MIRLGTALKSTERPFHRCVVLSDPPAAEGNVVLVRITTDDGSWPDRDCLLGPNHWSELEHASTVAYSTCKCGPVVASLQQAIKNGMFIEISSPPAAVLRTMISAARKSSGMSPRAKRWLADESKIA